MVAHDIDLGDFGAHAFGKLKLDADAVARQLGEHGVDLGLVHAGAVIEILQGLADDGEVLDV